MACTSIQKKTLGVSKYRERMLVQSKDDWGAQVALLQSPILPNRNTILQQKLPSQNRPLTNHIPGICGFNFGI
jgi:hypothetical protein